MRERIRMSPVPADRLFETQADVPEPKPVASLAAAWVALRRRMWLVLVVSVAGVVAAVAASGLSPARYTAKVLVLVQPREARVLVSDSVISDLPADPATVETQVRLIRSPENLRAVSRHLDLARDPRFDPEAAAAGDTETALAGARRMLADVVRRLLPRREAERAGAAGGSALPVDDPVVLRLERNLGVAPEGRSFVIGVSYTSTSPELAAAIANAVAELYVAGETDLKRRATSQAADWLRDRLAMSRAEVEGAEAAVQTFRAANNLAAERRTDIIEENLVKLQDELIQAEADLTARKARLSFLRDLVRRQVPLESATEVLSSPAIAELRRQDAELARTQSSIDVIYGERHPRMQEIRSERHQIGTKIEAEIGRMVTNLEHEHRIADARVAGLRSAAAAARAQSNQAQAAEVRLDQLTREAHIARQRYEGLLQRFNEVREQEEIVDSSARVMSVAGVPTVPSSPGMGLLATMGGIVSFLFAALLALVLEQRERGLRSQEEVQSALGVPALGLLPDLRALRGRPVHVLLSERLFSAEAESIRLLLTRLRFWLEQDGARTVLISSSVPAEGKTTLTISLAVYTALAGFRTVLVDLDLRHPRIHAEFSVPQEPGLVDHLDGGVPLEGIVTRHEPTGLDIVPAGRLAADPVPLVAGARFRALIGRLRSTYDYVFVDTSPLLGISDAQIAAPLFDDVLLAVRWDRTPRTFARNAIEALRRTGTDVSGVVLTRVDVGKHALYGYGDAGSWFQQYRKYYVK